MNAPERFVAAVVLVCLAGCAEESDQPEPRKTGVVTLIIQDRLRAAFSFADMAYSQDEQDGRVFNNGSTLILFAEDGHDTLMLPASAGIKGAFRDLGNRRLHRNGISLYHSIESRDGSRLNWHPSGYDEGRELGGEFLQLKNPGAKPIRCRVALGHIYIGHVVGPAATDNYFLKLLVTRHVPRQSVEFRYEVFTAK